MIEPNIALFGTNYILTSFMKQLLMSFLKFLFIN